jgi:hypothetical protein
VRHLCAGNQWSSNAFHRYLSRAIAEQESEMTGMSERRRARIMREYARAYLLAWLDAALPAGSA